MTYFLRVRGFAKVEQLLTVQLEHSDLLRLLRPFVLTIGPLSIFQLLLPITLLFQGLLVSETQLETRA